MLHRRTLRALERLHSDSLYDLSEKLADHAFRAEEWGAAATYLVQAADKAVDLSAYPKAALARAGGARCRLPPRKPRARSSGGRRAHPHAPGLRRHWVVLEGRDPAMTVTLRPDAALALALDMARRAEDRWIEVTVLRSMAEQADGERRSELLACALQIAEQNGFRPEADRARRALDRTLGRPATVEPAQAEARVTT